VTPYATWTINLPFQNESRTIFGVTYDPSTRRLFLTSGSDGPRPLVHVFTLAGAPNGQASGLCR
jgi:hypothetical protein